MGRPPMNSLQNKKKQPYKNPIEFGEDDIPKPSFPEIEYTFGEELKKATIKYKK